MSADDEDPYPPSPLERWADRWIPRLIWFAVGGVLVAMFSRGWS